MHLFISMPILNEIGSIGENPSPGSEYPCRDPARGRLSLTSTTCLMERETISKISTSANGPMVQKFRRRTSPDRPV